MTADLLARVDAALNDYQSGAAYNHADLRKLLADVRAAKEFEVAQLATSNGQDKPEPLARDHVAAPPSNRMFEVARIEALKATPGPFDIFSNNGIDWMVSTLSIPQHPIALCGPSKSNAERLCAVLNAFPTLAAAVRQGERMRELIESLLDQASDWWPKGTVIHDDEDADVQITVGQLRQALAESEKEGKS